MKKRSKLIHNVHHVWTYSACLQFLPGGFSLSSPSHDVLCCRSNSSRASMDCSTEARAEQWITERTMMEPNDFLSQGRNNMNIKTVTSSVNNAFFNVYSNLYTSQYSPEIWNKHNPLEFIQYPKVDTGLANELGAPISLTEVPKAIGQLQNGNPLHSLT